MSETAKTETPVQWTITQEQIQTALNEYCVQPGRLFAAAMGAQEFLNHLITSVTITAPTSTPPAPLAPPAKKRHR
jgi:hypothetical protein